MALALVRQGYILWYGPHAPDWNSNQAGYTGVGEENTPHEIVLASGERVIRAPHTGDEKSAYTRLRQLQQTYRFADPIADEPGFAEKRLLDELTVRTPAAYDEEARIDYFEQTGPYLLSAAVRRANGKQLRRIVSWGMALAVSSESTFEDESQEWMLFAMARPLAQAGDGALEFRPPGAELVLAFQTPEGGVSAVFQGAGDRDLWKARFAKKLTSLGAEKVNEDATRQSWRRDNVNIQLNFAEQPSQTSIHLTTTINQPQQQQ